MALKPKQTVASSSAAAVRPLWVVLLLMKPPFLVSEKTFAIENTKRLCPHNFFLKFQKLLFEVDRSTRILLVRV